MNNLSISVALSAMKLAIESITDAKGKVNTAQLGITQAQWLRFVGPDAWTYSERGEMTSIFMKVLNFVTDRAGVPPLLLCAEYTAATVALFTGAANVQTACAFLDGSHPTAAELSTHGRDSAGVPNADASQLFAMVLYLRDTDARVEFAAQWDKVAAAAKAAHDSEVVSTRSS